MSPADIDSLEPEQGDGRPAKKGQTKKKAREGVVLPPAKGGVEASLAGETTVTLHAPAGANIEVTVTPPDDADKGVENFEQYLERELEAFQASKASAKTEEPPKGTAAEGDAPETDAEPAPTKAKAKPKAKAKAATKAPAKAKVAAKTKATAKKAPAKTKKAAGEPAKGDTAAKDEVTDMPPEDTTEGVATDEAEAHAEAETTTETKVADDQPDTAKRASVMERASGRFQHLLRAGADFGKGVTLPDFGTAFRRYRTMAPPETADGANDVTAPVPATVAQNDVTATPPVVPTEGEAKVEADAQAEAGTNAKAEVAEDQLDADVAAALEAESTDDDKKKVPELPKPYSFPVKGGGKVHVRHVATLTMDATMVRASGMTAETRALLLE